MDIVALISLAATKFPVVTLIATILGALVVLGQVLVAVTPSPKDNEAYDKIMNMAILGPILKALSSFAPIQKK